MEMRGRKHHKADKQNKKKTVVAVEGKKRSPHAPKTDVLQRTEPGEEVSEVSRIAPELEAAARGRPRMDADQPSWQSAQGGAVLPEGSSGESPARWAEADVGISPAI